MARQLPPWLYASHKTDVLRVQRFGSGRTVLSLLLMTSSDGWRIWIFSVPGWSLTFGGEDPVFEGLIATRESQPHTRARTWRIPMGRVLQLVYSPPLDGESDG